MVAVNDQEREYARQLERERIEQMKQEWAQREAIRQSKQASQNPLKRENVDRQILRLANKKKISIKEQEDAQRMVKNFGMWTAVGLLSVLADILTLIPLIGNLMSFMFSIAIWFVYAVNGYFNRDFGPRAARMAITAIGELLPGVGMLPIYTVSAIINYRIAKAKARANVS